MEKIFKVTLASNPGDAGFTGTQSLATGASEDGDVIAVTGKTRATVGDVLRVTVVSAEKPMR